MMNFDMLFLFLFVSLTFLVLGFARKQYMLVLVGGIFLIFVGSFTLNGIQMQSGSLIVENSSNTTTVTSLYTIVYPSFPSPFGSGMVLIGLAILFIGIMGMFEKPKGFSSSEDDDLSDDG